MRIWSFDGLSSTSLLDSTQQEQHYRQLNRDRSDFKRASPDSCLTGFPPSADSIRERPRAELDTKLHTAQDGESSYNKHTLLAKQQQIES